MNLTENIHIGRFNFDLIFIAQDIIFRRYIQQILHARYCSFLDSVILQRSTV